MIGRSAELARTDEALRTAKHGGSAMLVIEGEAGIGKSELVAAIRRLAAELGFAVAAGAARPLERNRPFGVVADALELRSRSTDPRRAAIGRTLVGDSERGDARFRLIDDVVELVESECAAGPLLLVLEDLHWADESSLATIRALADEVTDSPLLLSLTLRPSPRTPELDALLADCRSSGAEFVQLQPLTAAEVAELVHDHVGGSAGPTLSSIVARAGGNPLWVVETLRSLSSEGWLRSDADGVDATADELPRTLRDLVLRRLGYLPQAALDLLQLTAVLGESVSVEDVALVAERDHRSVVADLAEAFRARLLDEREDTLVFRHQLVQQAIYEDLPAPTRRILHRDAATKLAAGGAEASKCASHLLLGAERGDIEAVRLLRRAATEVAARSPSAAVVFARRAGELLPATHEMTDLLQAELATALMRAGQVAEATEIAEGVLARPHRDDVDLALQLTVIDALSLQNRTAELTARAETALRSNSLGPVDRAFVLTQASYGQTFAGYFVEGEARARRAFDLALEADSVAMQVWSLGAQVVATKTQGRYAEAVAMSRRAVALAFDPLDEAARQRFPHFFLGMSLADSDEFDDALVAYTRALEEAEHLDARWLLPDMLALQGEVRFLVGEWNDAWTELDAASQLAHANGQVISIPQSRAYQSLMAHARGEPESAHACIGALIDDASHADAPYGTEMVAYAAATLAETEADLDRAYGLLLRTWEHDTARNIRYYERYLAPPLVRLAEVLGHRDEGAAVVAQVESSAALAPEVPSVRSAAMRCRGLLDANRVAMAEAVHHARGAGRVWDLATTCEDAARVSIRAGDSRGAVDLLSEAADIYERLEAHGRINRVNNALRAAGVRRGARGQRSRPSHGWESLTRGERAVADLVARGLTNREVARRLHVSPHTVNTHLRHVFQKLEVTTRAALAAAQARAEKIT